MALGVGVAAGLWGTDQPGLEASVDRLVNASYSRPMVGAQERRLSATMSQDLIFFFSAKSFFIVSIWSNAWAKTPRWLKRCLMIAGSNSGRSQIPQECGGGPQGPLGSQGF